MNSLTNNIIQNSGSHVTSAKTGSPKVFVFFMLCLLPLSLTISMAQVSLEWARTYDGITDTNMAHDHGIKVVTDSYGNVYVSASSVQEAQIIHSDYVTIKYNSAGVIQWVRRYNGPIIGSNDEPRSISVDNLGNVYVTGKSSGNGTGYDYCTIKYDNAGNPSATWPDNGFGVGVRRYNGPGNSGNNNDEAYSVTVINGSMDVYVTGWSTGSGETGNPDIITIKYSSAGTQMWAVRYNGLADNFDAGYSITADGSGNVYITGETTTNSTSSRDFCTIKYNFLGVQQWLKAYNGESSGSDAANTVAVDGSGSVFVTGYIWVTSSSKDYCTIKYNSTGAQQWVSTYNGPGNNTDEPASLSIDGSGNAYVTGRSMGSTTSVDYCTIKYDPNGNPSATWADNGAGVGVRRYNGPGNNFDDATGIVTDGTGNAYVTGRSIGSNSNTDICTIKYSSIGGEAWNHRYNHVNNSNDAGASIALDPSGKVLVTGSTANPIFSDVLTIKLSQSLTGINVNENQIPGEYSISQNYPNPFNPSTTIDYSLPEDGHVSIKVFDITGREVAVLVSGYKTKGSYSIEFNASNLSSGIYFYKLKTYDFEETKKMMVIK